MSRDNRSTDGEPTVGRLRRRGVLRSVGAGAALSVGGYGFASQEGGDETPTPTEGEEEEPVQRGCDPCIDTVTGYHVLAEDQEPTANLQAEHLVDMRVADVDVLFQEPDDTDGSAAVTAGGETPTETPAGNETDTPTGNETATPTPTETATPTATPTEETPTEEGEEGPQPTGFPDFFFDPVGLLVRPGEVVEFTTMQPEVPAPGPVEHTVTAFHPRTGFSQRVPDGVPGFSSGPVYSEESWLYEFEAEGVYDVLCLPHFGLGMVMRLVVMAEDSERVPEEPAELQETDEMAPPNPASVLAADELDPQNVVEQEAVAWIDLGDIATEPPMDGPGGGGGGPDGEGDGGANGGGEQGDAGEGNEP